MNKFDFFEVNVMEKERRTFKNGAITLVEYDGTFYHEQTDEKVIQVLNRFMNDRDTRLKFCFGNTDTGMDWEEEMDTTGYVGRSTGNVAIPILLHNKRSFGGGNILDLCVVKIEYANKSKGGVLYQHPLYYKEV